MTVTPDAYPQTQFFKACRGVFEGGGCRGAGYVGAYEAAIECGVNFSEVAGTSAGSVIAVLIGAGATPDYLLKTCAYLKFNELLADPEGRIKTPWLARAVSPLLGGRKGLFGRVLREGSAHSSVRLQAWVDDRLAELLPHATRPILFRDLILPTWVVATDLAGCRPKVWSSEQTPNESVALAVRCSSSIPFFFEPVEIGNDLYVDGGMLSNLPTFVFSDRSKSPLALGGRILSFRLMGAESQRAERNIGWLAQRLIGTAIDGSAIIQSGMQGNISTVAIETGKVSSTNFDISQSEVDFLLRSGRTAVTEFIRNEHDKLNDTFTGDVARYGEDHLFDDVAMEMSTPGRRLVVGCKDTKWFWGLFPSVAHWMFSGARVDILVRDGQASARELYRRGLLSNMGARIVVTPSLPFEGFVLSRADDNHNAAFVLSPSDSQYAPLGTVYSGVKHRPVIAALLNMLDAGLGTTEVKIPSLTLRSGSSETLISIMKAGVHQYLDDQVSIDVREIALQGNSPQPKMLVRRIRSYKYRQIPHLVDLYKRFNLPVFSTAEIVADGKYVSTIVPPVLEHWGDDLVAIEGNTRLYHEYRNGAPRLHALVVSGVSVPPPGTPVKPGQALLSTYNLEVEHRIQDFNHARFRSIEGAVRPEK